MELKDVFKFVVNHAIVWRRTNEVDEDFYPGVESSRIYIPEEYSDKYNEDYFIKLWMDAYGTND